MMVLVHTWTSAHKTYTIRESDTGIIQLSDGESRMSSLSRRACYKCGNVGHYAEVCSSSERLCYNCKQPGKRRARARIRTCADRYAQAMRAITALTHGRPRVSL